MLANYSGDRCSRDDVRSSWTLGWKGNFCEDDAVRNSGRLSPEGDSLLQRNSTALRQLIPVRPAFQSFNNYLNFFCSPNFITLLPVHRRRPRKSHLYSGHAIPSLLCEVRPGFPLQLRSYTYHNYILTGSSNLLH